MTINIVLILTGVLIALISLIIYIANKMCDVAMKPEITKRYINFIFNPKEKEAMKEATNKSNEWLNNNSEEIEIISKDGLKLKGYQIKSAKKSDIWVIAVHGYMGRGSDMVEYVQKFIEKGYNILILDLRTHGKSEGKYIGMGWLDHYDLQMWIDRIISENEQCQIILYGMSMGAATVMMTTGEELPTNIKVCIEDCGYTSVWEEFSRHLKRIFHLPPFPFLYVASFISKIKIGFGFKEATSIKQIQKSKTPTLFIHGTEDKFVPFFMLEKLYKEASCKKQKLEIEGATHTESSRVDSEKYWFTVMNFIDKYLEICN